MRYKWKTKPYAHQVRAVKKLLSNKFGGALLMEPRTGKTKVAIDYLSILNQHNKIDRAVVICPSRVMDVWVEQLHDHCPRRFHTIVWDKDARKHGLPKVSSRHDLTIVIVNYEAFATPGPKTSSGRLSKRAGRFKHRDMIYRWLDNMPAVAILDESHKIKSPSGKAANMIVSMSNKFAYRLILTGTPLTKAKRAFDAYMQWKFLNPQRFSHLPNVVDFKNYYGQWTNRNGYPQWLRGRNLDDLRYRLRQDSFMVKREDCFDLPNREEIFLKVPLTSSGKLYDELAEEMVAEVEHLQELYDLKTRDKKLTKEIHTIEASIKLTLNLRLSQITGGCATTDEGKVIRVGSEKLNALREILEDLIEKDQKVVVAARFKADLSAIELLGNELSIATFRLSGGMTREQSTEAIHNFRELDESALFVMQPQAGSLGIDLSTASHFVWYSLTPSWTDFVQSNDRIALSRKSTTFTYILAKNTIDEVLLDTLKTDTKFHDKIMQKPTSLIRRA